MWPPLRPCWTACCITGTCSSAARAVGAPSWRRARRQRANSFRGGGKRKMGNREGKGVFVNRDSELDAFKRKVDLRQFAVSLGYEMDRQTEGGSAPVCRQSGL